MAARTRQAAIITFHALCCSARGSRDLRAFSLRRLLINATYTTRHAARTFSAQLQGWPVGRRDHWAHISSGRQHRPTAAPQLTCICWPGAHNAPQAQAWEVTRTHPPGLGRIVAAQLAGSRQGGVL